MTGDRRQVTYFSRLDTDECWALLADADVGRIAWHSGDGLSVLPVNFNIVEGRVIIHTGSQSPLAALVTPTEVAFQADDIDGEAAVGWSVLVRGVSGPAPSDVSSVSWLEERQIGLSIAPTTIAGRVMSGSKKS